MFETLAPFLTGEVAAALLIGFALACFWSVY